MQARCGSRGWAGESGRAGRAARAEKSASLGLELESNWRCRRRGCSRLALGLGQVGGGKCAALVTAAGRRERGRGASDGWGRQAGRQAGRGEQSCAVLVRAGTGSEAEQVVEVMLLLL